MDLAIPRCTRDDGRESPPGAHQQVQPVCLLQHFPYLPPLHEPPHRRAWRGRHIEVPVPMERVPRTSAHRCNPQHSWPHAAGTRVARHTVSRARCRPRHPLSPETGTMTSAGMRLPRADSQTQSGQPLPRTDMTRRILAGALSVGAALWLAACSDDTTAPHAERPAAVAAAVSPETSALAATVRQARDRARDHRRPPGRPGPPRAHALGTGTRLRQSADRDRDISCMTCHLAGASTVDQRSLAMGRVPPGWGSRGCIRRMPSCIGARRRCSTCTR